MRVVEHLMTWGSYAKGQRSSWSEEQAQALVDRGLAKPYNDPEQRETPERRGIAEKMIRKVKRPTKE